MHILLAGSLPQRLRLFSGLILFAFALTHFLNHAIGLVGVEAMEAVQDWRTAVTRSWVGSAVLIGALATHVILALYRIARRATLRMPAWELVQIASGLMIPFLLIPHIVGMRLAGSLFGAESSYQYGLAGMWPNLALEQTLLLLLVWLHGCIGLHFWLRLWPGYRAALPYLIAAAVAVPLLGLTGFASGGREMATALAAPGAFERFAAEVRFPNEADFATLAAIRSFSQWSFYGALGAVLGFIAFRWLLARLGPRIGITYFAGPTVQAVPGPTLLEISRQKGVPHVSVCGGRGRCSTCRVHVDEGVASLTPPGPVESRTLSRIRAEANVRLACQIRPAADLSVTRLVRPGTGRLAGLLRASAEAHGVERVLTILFLDIRGFTKLTQQRLPYDVVFVLNRLFEHLGDAIRAHGGRIDKYLGDGLMASFGRESGAALGARQALAAAKALDLALDRANAEIAAELGQPVVIGMGLHAGPVVLGEIGHPSGMTLDVIGETVNAAARLEALTKDERCQLVVSASVLDLAGVALAGLPGKTVAVRGIDQPLEVTLVGAARSLPDLPPIATNSAASAISAANSR